MLFSICICLLLKLFLINLLSHSISTLSFICASSVFSISSTHTYTHIHTSCMHAQLCGITIIRAGMVFEEPLRQCVQDVTIGQILIQTNAITRQPEVMTTPNSSYPSLFYAISLFAFSVYCFISPSRILSVFELLFFYLYTHPYSYNSIYF